jgi:hypothetical protein
MYKSDCSVLRMRASRKVRIDACVAPFCMHNQVSSLKNIELMFENVAFTAQW